MNKLPKLSKLILKETNADLQSIDKLLQSLLKRNMNSTVSFQLLDISGYYITYFNCRYIQFMLINILHNIM